MLANHRIEGFVKTIVDQNYDEEVTDRLLSDLSFADRKAVLKRVSATAKAQAAQSYALVKLARDHGCPDGVPMLPWLMERGLIS